MAELEVTREVYEQLREKLKAWQQEQRQLLSRLEQEARKAQGKPTSQSRQTVEQLESITSRISQLEARLRSVHIVDQHRPEE